MKCDEYAADEGNAQWKLFRMVLILLAEGSALPAARAQTKPLMKSQLPLSQFRPPKKEAVDSLIITEPLPSAAIS